LYMIQLLKGQDYSDYPFQTKLNFPSDRLTKFSDLC